MLRLRVPRGEGSIPGQGTTIPVAASPHPPIPKEENAIWCIKML